MTTKQAMELKPCPFCGGVAEMQGQPPRLAPEQWVQCSACKAASDTCSGTERAATSWNRRFTRQAEPVARAHISLQDDGPYAELEVLNGELLQPSMSPVNLYAAPVVGAGVREARKDELIKVLEAYEAAIDEAEAIFGGEYGDHYGPMFDLAMKARDARRALSDAVTDTKDTK